MPLPSKVKSARHRQRVNSDPAARAEYLARRRESYQRRKLQGKIPYVKSSDLPERVKKKQREKWRAASSAYRERKKMTNAVLDLTPPSMENIPPVLVGVDVAQEQPEDAQAAQISHREVSCFRKHAEMKTCLCYQPVKAYLRDTTEDPLSPPEPPKKQPPEDLSGKFVIVTYYELPYVGQVLQVVGEEVQVTSMRQAGEKNLFMWPQVPDIIYYYKKDVVSVIVEPEPATSRHTKLSSQDWAKFKQAWG